jgi:hypothetical protein
MKIRVLQFPWSNEVMWNWDLCYMQSLIYVGCYYCKNYWLMHLYTLHRNKTNVPNMYNFKPLFCQFGCIPLHGAASTGNGELCEFLIEEGAEVLMLLTGLDRPLMHAVICENKGVIFLCLPCCRLLQHPVYLIHRVMIITWLRHPTSSMEFKIRISKSKFSYFSVDRLVQSAIF